MLLAKIFGLTLALPVLGTRIWIAVMGEKFQKVEQAAHTGGRKPWWFYLSLALYTIFYAAVLVNFYQLPGQNLGRLGAGHCDPGGSGAKGGLGHL